MKRTIIYVQCRTGSSRFPGKILKKINGVPYLKLLIERIRKSKKADDVIVITTNQKEDDVLVDLCNYNSLPYFRGSAYDLLDRHYQANKIFKADYVVKVPSDCPFADPEIIDDVISVIHSSSLIDYASNYHPPTFPDGLDVEVARSDVLEIAWSTAQESHEREHTFPYIWDNPEMFNIFNLINNKGNMFKTHRWTLDYPEDFNFIESIYKEFDYSNNFYFDDLIKLLLEKPFLAKINAMHNGVNWYRNVPTKLRTIDNSLIQKESYDAS